MPIEDKSSGVFPLLLPSCIPHGCSPEKKKRGWAYQSQSLIGFAAKGRCLISPLAFILLGLHSPGR
jgi:hypothetical protein